MGIFDFLRAPAPQQHPQLGLLHYSGGRWRGIIELEQGKRVPLFLPGTRSGPLPEGLQLAEGAPDWWTRVRPAVETEIYAHYTVGREAGISDMPELTRASDVWPSVTLSSVEIRPHRSLDELQVAIRVSWDDEHTLGALVRDAALVELNGSILELR
jgi:hypothetical protein